MAEGAPSSPNAGSMASIRNNFKSPAVLPRPNSRPISATSSLRPVQMHISVGGMRMSIAVSNATAMAPSQMKPSTHTIPISSSVAPKMLQDEISLADEMSRMNLGAGNLSNEMTNDMGMSMGSQQIMNLQANFVNQPRMPLHGKMHSMAIPAKNYGSYNNMPAGQRQMPVNTTSYDDPSMARPRVLGGIMPQGVPNQNHMSNGMIMGDKSNDNMQMMQQNPMGMMGNIDKSNMSMQPMRVMLHGNMKRHRNPQVQDVEGLTMPQGSSQQQPTIQTSTNVHNNNVNQPQATNQDQVVAMPVRSGLSQALIKSFANPWKRRLLQQRLVLLLHVCICLTREQNGVPINCAYRQCRPMKDVLRHMKICNQGINCHVRHCVLSRLILGHWRMCHERECKVCRPLRRVSRCGHVHDWVMVYI